MITLTTEQARQIEEALASCETGKWDATYDEILVEEALSTIRAAKAQELNLNCKSVQKRLATSWGYVKAEHPMDYDQGFVDGVEAQLAEPVKQEPVGWTHAANLVDDGYGHIFSVHSSEPAYDDWVPVYAAPVRTKDLAGQDLCDLEIAVGWKGDSYDFDVIAKAVIAAYREKNRA